MPNANYKAGRRFEYEQAHYYESLGFAVVRAAGSHGLFDLVCLREHEVPLLVQCKLVERDGRASALLSRFHDNPPFPPTRKFRQAMDVRVKGSKEVHRVEV